MLGELGNRIADMGAQGVAVFFVISGYSVASSYVASNSYWDYINKRLWRIAPLYFFWIGVATLTGLTAIYWQSQFNTTINTYNIFMHLAFLSFLDYKIANSVLGVEWSIPIEVFWYFLIPFWMSLIQTRKQMVVSILGSIFFYIMLIKFSRLLPLPSIDAELVVKWSPFPYAMSFCLGIVAFRLRNLNINFSKWGDFTLVTVTLTTGLFVMYANLKFGYLFFSLITFVIILFGSRKAFLYRCIFTNKIVVYLGTISYGIYLCHLSLLAIFARFNLISNDGSWRTFMVLSICAILVSSLTYFLVELPFQKLGKVFYILTSSSTRPYV